jgi:hypothetical protein
MFEWRELATRETVGEESGRRRGRANGDQREIEVHVVLGRHARSIHKPERCCIQGRCVLSHNVRQRLQVSLVHPHLTELPAMRPPSIRESLEAVFVPMRSWKPAADSDFSAAARPPTPCGRGRDCGTEDAKDPSQGSPMILMAIIPTLKVMGV